VDRTTSVLGHTDKGDETEAEYVPVAAKRMIISKKGTSFTKKVELGNSTLSSADNFYY